ncbi:MAG: malectin [Sedimentisphaerales bacterium]|nr:malectin [Sedimentisphaerales bacterium]
MARKTIFTAILVTFTLLIQYGCKTTEIAKEMADTEQTQVAAEPAKPVEEPAKPTVEEIQPAKEPINETPVGTPQIAIRVNCGTADGAEAYTDADGKVWQPDRLISDTLDWGAADGQIIQRSTLEIKDTKSPVIYQSETYSMSAYKFKVPAGKYTVKLHFAETYEGITGEGQRVFDVSINDKKVIEKLDPYKEAGAFAKPVVKEFKDIEPANGVITIGFTSNIENPQICGIEVVSQGAAESSASSEKFVLRVNCGSFDGAYTDKAGNVWQQDQEKADNNKWGAVYGSVIGRPGLNVPDTNCPIIYESERYSMDAYRFEVPNGKYTVKLHFAETYEGISGVGERVFSVSLNGKTILETMDPYKEAGDFNKPAVKTYKSVEPAEGKIEIGFTPSIENPQICGIEIVAE